MRFLPTLIYNADRAIERDMVEAVDQDLAEAFALSPLERAMHEEQERKERLIQEHDATAQRISKGEGRASSDAADRGGVGRMDIGLNYYQPVDPLRPLMHPESKERRTQKLRTERRRAEEHCLRQIKAMPEHMRWERVLKRVCLLTGVTRQELMANYRRRDFVFARYMAYYWLARLTKLSLASIATRLGRDHSTVIYGVRRYREMRLAKGWCLPPARVQP